MPFTLTQNYFELFSLPQQYVLERSDLDARYRKLQHTVHPDRYVTASDQERRVSMQQATHINEAYQVLKDPLRRGRYLLELRGHAVEDQQTTHQDPEFLMQQIELREALADIRQQGDPLKALDGFAREVQAQYRTLGSELAQALDAGEETEQAVSLVLKMQYFMRLQNEVQELEADLEDELD